MLGGDGLPRGCCDELKMEVSNSKRDRESLVLGIWDFFFILNAAETNTFRPKNRGPKKCFRGRQVGAFSDFCARHTGGPFIFSLKTLFFRKIDRFRG